VKVFTVFQMVDVHLMVNYNKISKEINYRNKEFF